MAHQSCPTIPLCLPCFSARLVKPPICGAVSPEPAYFPGPSPVKLFFGSRQETAMKSSELCVKATV